MYKYRCGCPRSYKYNGPAELDLCSKHAPKRAITGAPPVTWLAIGGGRGGGAFPTAEDKWLSDREHRRKKEIESVERHGVEYPNLLTV